MEYFLETNIKTLKITLALNQKKKRKEDEEN